MDIDLTPAPRSSRVARLSAVAFVAVAACAVAAVAVTLPASPPDSAEPASSIASTTVEPAATTVASTTTTVATTTTSTTAAPPPMTTIAVSMPPSTLAAPTHGPDGWWRTAVLAQHRDAVDVWTSRGKVASVGTCVGTDRCSVVQLALSADAVIALRYRDYGAADLVRLPLDGGEPTIIDGPAGGSVDGLTAGPDGRSIWWLERSAQPDGAAIAHRWPGPDPAIDVGPTYVLSPSPDGRSLAYARYDVEERKATVVVRDLATGAERSIALSGEGIPMRNGLTWTPDGRRLVAQLSAEAEMIEVSDQGALRHGSTVGFVASCVDTSQRIIGVQRRSSATAVAHTLAEADPSSGRVTTWTGDVRDGMLACRGDGAALVVSWSGDGAVTELRAVRASGKTTLLGRDYLLLDGPRGGGSFSAMHCGAGEGA